MPESPKAAPSSVKHTLRREAGSRVTLDVEVEADRLARAADAAFAKHVQHAKIPGFRPGKAPRAMYERTYGKEHLWEDAADDLMDQTYREILDAERLDPIDRPQATLTHLKEGEPLRYTATVVVRPDVSLGDYTAHGATVEAGPPSDEEIDKTNASMHGEKALPALDDEFAKTVGVADLASLKKAVRNELAHATFHEARDEAADKAVEHAMATSTVEVPEILVEDEMEHLVNDLKARVKQESVSWEKFLLQARKTEDEIRKEWRPVAERRAKSLLVLDAIARKEGITVSGDELAAQAAMSQLAEVDPQALRSPAVLASLARSIRNRKTVDKLVGLDSPDAEREAIRKAGGDVEEPKKPEIIVPERTDATSEGREAIRALLEKK